MNNDVTRLAGIILAACTIVLGTTACAPAAPNPTHAPTVDIEEVESTEPAAMSENRSGVLLLVEATFAGFNGKATWEDKTLVVAIDGDAEEELESQFTCALLDQYLESGETARVEFPNGTVDCAG